MNSPVLRHAGLALTALSLAAATWLATDGLWAEAAIMAGFVLASTLFALSRKRLPSVFTFLFASVAAMNAAGYVLELWRRPFWFDELAHLLTPFAIVAAIAWIMIRRNKAQPGSHPVRYFAKIVLIGLAVGVLWEAFEWLIGIIGDTADTLSDLLMDTIGAMLAAIFCSFCARREEAALAQ